jgi:hypothetical protein
LKSCEAYEFLKRDLSEFKETVSKDTAVVVSNTASYVRETMRDTITGISNTVAPLYDELEDKHSSDFDIEPKNNTNDNITDESLDQKPINENIDQNDDNDWATSLTNKAKEKLNTLMGSIADAFVINRDYFEDEDEMYVVSGDKLVAIERWKTLLSDIQKDPKTYCREPSGPPEHYESWLMTFNLIDYQRQMDHLLQNIPQMKQFYSELVPNSLSDVEFWHRYYYRVHQIREIERKRIEERSESKESFDDSSKDNQNNKVVEIKLLKENSSFASDDMKQELISIASNDCSDKEDLASSPHSTDTRRSEAGSEDWEKTDLNEIGDDSNISKNLNEKSYASDEDIKDWVKYE